MKKLQDILYDLRSETISSFIKVVMTIDQISWCLSCKEYEATELARTALPFVAQVIVEGGRPTNRYVVTWEAVE